MTEEEWLACDLPGKMVYYSKSRISDRKRTLLQVACLRRIEAFLPGPISKGAATILEQSLDGSVPEEKLATMRADALEEALAFPNPHGKQLPEAFAGTAVYYSDDTELLMERCAETTAWAKAGMPDAISAPEEIAQCLLIRDIFGNPFRPAAVDPSWLTSDVLALATGIYQDRAYDRMPILADALQDAGCDIDDVLNHCRSEGPHVRGCWVVDLLTGRT